MDHVLTDRFKPLKIGFAYNAVTYLLFVFGPIAWPNRSSLLLFALLAASWSFYAMGFSVSTRIKPTKKGPRRSYVLQERQINILLICGVLLNLAAIKIYTGINSWNFSQIFGDQSQNYLNTVRRIQSSSRSERLSFLVFRSALFPFVILALFAVLVRFRQSSLRSKILMILLIISTVLFSFARGTDREILDILTILFTATMCSRARKGVKLISPVKTATKVIVALMALLLFMSVFTARKEARLSKAEVCISAINTCSTLKGSGVPYAISLLTAYVSQGYHGTNLAMSLPPSTGLGLGHSTLLTEIIGPVFDRSFKSRLLTAKLTSLGWEDGYRWPSAYTYFANDVTFWLVPLIMYGLGLIFGKSWTISTRGRNLAAIVVVYYSLVTCIYLSSNFQVGGSGDSYTALLFWSWFVSMGYTVDVFNKNED
jgi:hypothetical protein